MRFIFDFVIVLVLLLSAYWMYVIIRSFFIPENKKVKTKIFRIVLAICLGIIAVVIFYGSFIEPRRIKVKTIEINIGKTASEEKLTIVFLSDLHVGPYKKDDYVKKIIKNIERINPDLIFLGGDMLFGKEHEAKYLYPFKSLAHEYKIYAITGNHEYNAGKYGDPKRLDQTRLLRQNFNDWGITLLDNLTIEYDHKGEKITISGIEDIWTGKADLKKVRSNIDAQKTNLLLAHNPDVILDKDHDGFDLILSGHTHAGQIRLPWIGALMGVPTILGRNYDHGLFKFDENYLYISAGLGESGTRARLFNPPELTIIKIDP